MKPVGLGRHGFADRRQAELKLGHVRNIVSGWFQLTTSAALTGEFFAGLLSVGDAQPSNFSGSFGGVSDLLFCSLRTFYERLERPHLTNA